MEAIRIIKTSTVRSCRSALPRLRRLVPHCKPSKTLSGSPNAAPAAKNAREKGRQ